MSEHKLTWDSQRLIYACIGHPSCKLKPSTDQRPHAKEASCVRTARIFKSRGSDNRSKDHVIGFINRSDAAIGVSFPGSSNLKARFIARGLCAWPACGADFRTVFQALWIMTSRSAALAGVHAQGGSGRDTGCWFGHRRAHLGLKWNIPRQRVTKVEQGFLQPFFWKRRDLTSPRAGPRHVFVLPGDEVQSLCSAYRIQPSSFLHYHLCQDHALVGYTVSSGCKQSLLLAREDCVRFAVLSKFSA